MADSTIAEQSEMIDVQPSPIHGLGVFAARRIPADTYIGSYEGPIVWDEDNDNDYVLWILDEDGSGYGINGQNALRYVNHSSDANAIFYDEELWSLRTIEPGEEICHHYGDDWD